MNPFQQKSRRHWRRLAGCVLFLGLPIMNDAIAQDAPVIQRDGAADRKVLPLTGDAGMQVVPGDSLPEGVMNLLLEGTNLWMKGKIGEAVATYDAVERRVGGIDAPWARDLVVAVLAGKGTGLLLMGKNREAIAVCDEIDRRFGQDDAFRDKVAAALAFKVTVLWQEGRNGEAIAAADEIDRRFGQDDAIDMRERVASALAVKGVILWMEGGSEEAVAVLDAINRRFGTGNPPRRRVAAALFAKSVILREQGKIGEAIAVLDDFDRHFGEDDAPGARELVLVALVAKSEMLGGQGGVSPFLHYVSKREVTEEEAGQALAVHDEIDRRFGRDDAPSMRALVADALNGKARMLREWGRREEAIAVYDDIIRRFGEDDAPGAHEEVSLARLCKGEILEEQGGSAEAAAVRDGASRCLDAPPPDPIAPAHP
jgi:tetratricopeptide (TPR) repeat protein